MSAHHKALRTGLIAVSLILYFFIGYFTERDDFFLLLSQYTLLFLIYANLVFNKQQSAGEKLLFYSGLLFRMVFILAIPALSNDFFRFIWDGRLIVSGNNPFLFLPREIIDTPLGRAIDPGMILYEGMGDLQPHHYTCYPALNQYLFAFSSLLFPNDLMGNVIMIRLIIIAFDTGTYFAGRKLLQRLGMSPRLIFIYFLNPLAIIELSGNLHFEGVMLFFLAVSMLFLLRHRILVSALMFSLSVSVKLIPLIFLPLFYRRFGLWLSLLYYAAVLMITILLFIPFLNVEMIFNFFDSIDLYFRKFEFNASIYYLVREIGYHITGWNIISKAGPVLAGGVFLFTLGMALFRRNENEQALFQSMLMVLTAYYFLSTTVMPWYPISLLFISLFTPYRYVIVWTFTLIFSYQAYSNPDWQEFLWVNILGYFPVFMLMIYELISKKYYRPINN